MDSAKFFETAAKTKSLAVAGVVEEYSSAEAQRVVADIRARSEIRYAVGLSPESVSELRSNWPNFNWVEESVPLPPHPFAAYSRRAFTKWTLQQVGSVPIKDFGGNWLLHWSWNTGVHSCCPILDPRDGARQTRRELAMEDRLRSQGPKYDAFGELIKPNFCHNRAEDCKERALVGMSVDSAYDMGFRNTCRAMSRAGIELLYGNILFDPDMLIEEKLEGFVPGMNYHWRKKRLTGNLVHAFLDFGASLVDGECFNKQTQGAEYSCRKVHVGEGRSHMHPHEWEIEYFFQDDTVLNYTHNMAHILSIATGTYLQEAGVWYELERTGLKSGMLMYTITRCKGKFTHARANTKLFRPFVKDHMVVKFVRPNKFGQMLVQDFVTLQRDLVFAVSSLAFRAYKGDKSCLDQIQAIAGALSAKASTVIINGQSYQVGEKLDPVTFPYLAAAFFMFAAKAAKEVVEGVVNFTPNQGLVTWIKSKIGFEWEKILQTFHLRDKHDEWLVNQVEFYELSEVCLDWDEDELLGNDPTVEERFERGLQAYAEEKGKKSVNLERNLKTLAQLVELGKKLNLPLFDILQSAPEIRKDKWCVEGSLLEAIELEKTEWRMLSAEAKSISCQDPLSTDSKSRGWSWELSDQLPKRYEYVFVDGSFKKPEDLRGRHRVLVNDSFVIMNQQRMIASLTKALETVPVAARTVWIDGVAGCGKTFEILNTADIFHKDDLILTANKKSQEEIFQKLKCNGTSAVRVRTLDSYLLKPDVKAQRVFLDEAGLVHPGKILAAVRLSQCAELRCYGDSEQIPYVNRVEAEYPAKFLKLECDEYEKRETTWRCPADVTASLRTVYSQKEPKTKSTVLRSMSEKQIPSVSAVTHLDVNAYHLTMYQYDKAELRRVAKMQGLDDAWINSNIKTVHEAQGISVPSVVLYRFKTYDSPLFDSSDKKSYQLVALSRHTQRFLYVHPPKTQLPKDKVLKLVEYAKSRDSASLSCVQC